MKPTHSDVSTHAMDEQAVANALHHAAEIARQTAIATNTCLVVMEKGQLLQITAQQLEQGWGTASPKTIIP